MRAMMVATAMLLAACGAGTESSDDVPDPTERALPYGVIIGMGEDWQLTADPAEGGGVSFYADDGTEGSGAWSPPRMSVTQYVMNAGDVRATFEERSCELNGAIFPMQALIVIAEGRYLGCAAMRWDYQLIALMPQIDACIARSPHTRWVTYAGQQTDGNMLVRLDGGDAFDCSVTPGNMPEVISFGPRSDSLAVATERTALFVRGPGENPGGLCYDAPEVRSASGELLGWMVDPLGC